MIFNPGTYVKLLSNVPLDNSYTHTLSFSTVQAQTDYFNSKAVKIYEDFSYQRYDPSRGNIAALRIPEVADNLYNINYVMFRNNNFGTKWFYGFVRKISYINDGMTEIEYEIDIVQTWFFDYTIQDSFVVREHVNDDAKYQNLIDEDLDTGEYIVGNYNWVTNFAPETCLTVIAASFNVADYPQYKWVYTYIAQLQKGYQFNGITYYAFTNPSLAQAFIEIAIDAALSEGILTIFMYPTPLWPDIAEPDVPSGTGGAGKTIQTFKDKANQLPNFGGYTPRNNKLFNYPYSFLYVTNNNGSSANFRYEFFNGDPVFAVGGCLSCSPDFVLAPMNYKQANNPGINWNEAMGLGSWPICSWTTDTYKAYLAQNASRLGVERENINIDAAQGVISNSVGIFAGILSGNVGSAVSSGVNIANTLIDASQQIASYEANLKDRSKMPPQAHSTSGNETAFSLNLRNFSFYCMQITREYAQMIDQYFDMFGYKILKVKKPNITGRQSWNYVKTQNIQIIGNMPCDDMKSLCAIYDNGITFWHTPDVGNYSLPNGIVGG